MKLYTLSIATLLLAVLGCESAEQKPSDSAEGVQITNTFSIMDEWARPGTIGANTAAYFEMQNGLSRADTLLNVSSQIAAAVQVHESFIADDGLAGMRHQETLPVPSGSSVALKPGGLHVMFLQLKENVSVGDSIAVDLEFKHQGIRTLNIPVKSNSPGN